MFWYLMVWFLAYRVCTNARACILNTSQNVTFTCRELGEMQFRFATTLLWRSRDRFPLVSLGIFSMVPLTEPCALRSTQPLKVSTRDFSWGKGSWCVWLTNYHPCSAETSRKSGALIYPEPLGPPRPVAGDLYLLHFCYLHLAVDVVTTLWSAQPRNPVSIAGKGQELFLDFISFRPLLEHTESSFSVGTGAWRWPLICILCRS